MFDGFVLYLTVVLAKFAVILVQSNANLPSGHGQELGKHRQSEGHIEVLQEVPGPQDFWTKYVKTRTPVLFRGAAKDFPAFHLWTDSYLRQNFGDLEVKLEAKREKDNVPTGERGLGRDTVRSYLDAYQTKDSYVVSQLPDPMAKDVNVLPCLSCGTFTKHILEANLWLSSGGTSSLLHRDADNAINCLLNGTKDWILINPEYEDKIPVAKGDHGYGGFAVLDVNNVNLVKYSDFQHVPWHYANITPGDCLFLPYGYWHQVRSYGSKNMAVSVLFSRLKEFSASGCDQEKYASFPLSNSEMVWTYPGYGPQTLGNSDPFELRDMLVGGMQEAKRRNERFDGSTIIKLLTKADILLDEDEQETLAEMIYETLSNFTNGEITEVKIRNLTVEQLKSLVMYIDGDPANTEEYENIVFMPQDVREIIQRSLDVDHGSMTLSTLKHHHMNSGGSEKLARELFRKMDLNHDGVVSETEVTQTLDEILQTFEKKYKKDQSYDYYLNELKDDKEIMENIQKEHEEL